MLDITVRPADFRLALQAYRTAFCARVKRYAAEHVAYCLHQLGGMAGEW